jgi:hypothetical protein
MYKTPLEIEGDETPFPISSMTTDAATHCIPQLDRVFAHLEHFFAFYVDYSSANP